MHDFVPKFDINPIQINPTINKNPFEMQLII